MPFLRWGQGISALLWGCISTVLVQWVGTLGRTETWMYVKIQKLRKFSLKWGDSIIRGWWRPTLSPRTQHWGTMYLFQDDYGNRTFLGEEPWPGNP